MKVGIVGAGLSGLACASRLLMNKDFIVYIFEKDKEVGGLAGYVDLDGLKVTKTYHHVLRSDNFLQDELKRFKIPIWWRKVNIGSFAKSRVYPFNGPLSLLKFSPLSLRNRLRLGWLVLNAKYTETLRNITVRDWVCSKAGEKVFKDFVNPLVSTYFGSSENICAAYLAKRWGDESVSASNNLGYSNFPKIIDSYVNEINSSSRGEIYINCRIREICIKGDKAVISFDGREDTFDAVVVTCPPEEASSILKGIPAEALSQLKSVKYRACLCLLLRLEQKISNYYWVNVLDETIPFVACFEYGNLNPDLNEGLVYSVAYTDVSSPLWLSDDKKIYEEFISGLEAVFGSVPHVKSWYLFRSEWGTPIYEVGYKNVEINPHPRLYFAGVYRAFPEIRSSGPAIRTGVEAAQKIIKDARGKKLG